MAFAALTVFGLCLVVSGIVSHDPDTVKYMSISAGVAIMVISLLSIVILSRDNGGTGR